MNKIGFVALLAAGLLFYVSCGGDEENVLPAEDDVQADTSATPGSSSGTGKASKPNMGTMVDPRDGEVYQTIKVGDNVWMAENLRYVDSLIYTRHDSVWLYDFDTRESYLGYHYDFECKDSSFFYGCTYTYDIAMDYTAYQADSFNVGICPPGWHMPSLEEFQAYREDVKTEKVSFDNYGTPELIWTDRSTDDGVSIDEDGFHAYQVDDMGAVSYRVRKVSPFFGDDIGYSFKNKSEKLHVRCVRGGNAADSVERYARYKQRLDDTLQALSSSAAYQLYLSSSSEAELLRLSSSAVALHAEQMKRAKIFLNPDLEYSYFTDPRDSMNYAYLQIGAYVWMAENLRYLPDLPAYKNYIENDEAKYGEFYFYEVGTCYERSDVANVCPEGWHASTAAEWDDLMYSVVEHTNLQSPNVGWPNYPTNSSGFSMVPTTRQTSNMMIIFNTASFWTSTDTISKTPKIDTLGTAEEPVYDTTYVDFPCNISWYYNFIDVTLSRGCYGDNTCTHVRCVKDY